MLRRWAELMLAHQDDLGRLMTLEQGKPLAEARGEIAYAASFIEWFAEEAKRVDGEVLQPQRAGQRIVVLKQPIGVCAAITPWNFPAAMITRKVGPALAAGCTIVVKPAELTPLSAFALGVLGLEAGLPPGVLQIVAGNAPEIGAALCESPTVRKLSFTGSTGVGRVLAQQCAPTIKKLSLELGGNAPLIVFDDADIDRAIEGIVASKFRNAGQTCVCANRIFVQARACSCSNVHPMHVCTCASLMCMACAWHAATCRRRSTTPSPRSSRRPWPRSSRGAAPTTASPSALSSTAAESPRSRRT